MDFQIKFFSGADKPLETHMIIQINFASHLKNLDEDIIKKIIDPIKQFQLP